LQINQIRPFSTPIHTHHKTAALHLPWETQNETSICVLFPLASFQKKTLGILPNGSAVEKVPINGIAYFQFHFNSSVLVPHFVDLKLDSKISLDSKVKLLRWLDRNFW